MRKTIVNIVLLFLCVLNNTTVLAACNNAIVLSTPDNRFVLADGIATDNVTGLIWMRCSLGQSWDGSACAGTATQMNWKTALDTAESTILGEYSDWRLPNHIELGSIIERACYSPPFNQNIFPTPADSILWTSSPYSYPIDQSFVWRIATWRGDINISRKNTLGYVRLVRSGL